MSEIAVCPRVLPSPIMPSRTVRARMSLGWVFANRLLDLSRVTNATKCNFASAHPGNVAIPVLWFARCCGTYRSNTRPRDVHVHPSGSSGKLLVSGGSGSLYFFFQSSFLGRLAGGEHFGELVGFPLGAALFEDARQKLLSCLVGSAFLARQFGLGRNQPSLARRLQHRRPIPLQVRLHALERRDGCVEVGQQGVDFVDNSLLFGRGRRTECLKLGRSLTDVRPARCTLRSLRLASNAESQESKRSNYVAFTPSSEQS